MSEEYTKIYVLRACGSVCYFDTNDEDEIFDQSIPLALAYSNNEQKKIFLELKENKTFLEALISACVLIHIILCAPLLHGDFFMAERLYGGIK
ncbi:MAG: hypothetical protein ACTSQI_07795 [Candidatus Helarchaeota archaeon]